jgi:hypothetical protein
MSAASVDAAAADLLGRRVVEAAGPAAAAGGALAGQRHPGQAEVGQVHVVAVGQQDVGGLDVAVHEPGAVDGVERRAGALQDRRCGDGRQRAVAAHPRPQVVAFRRSA